MVLLELLILLVKMVQTEAKHILSLLMVQRLFGATEVDLDSEGETPTQEQDLRFIKDYLEGIIQGILLLMIQLRELVVEVRILVMVHMLGIWVLDLEEEAVDLDPMTLLIVELQAVQELLYLMV